MTPLKNLKNNEQRDRVIGEDELDNLENKILDLEKELIGSKLVVGQQ